MNHLTENHKPTMTSREIAELTGKRHGDVIRDIRSMIDEMEDDADLRHVVDVKDPRGYTAEFTPKGINWLASLWNGQRNEVAA
jgi:phage regulator Rha-like protein